MKKPLFAACLAICLATTGCGGIAKNTTEPTAVTTTEAATGAETETTAAETTRATTAAVTEATTQTAPTTETTTGTTAAPTEPITTESKTEAVTDPPAAPETAPVTAAAQSAPTKQQAQELIRALDTLERLVGCGLSYDADNVYTVNGTAYHKVEDPAFATTAAIRSYAEQYLTEEMIAERYSALVGGDQPIYLDGDDGLYMKDDAKGFYIFSDAAPGIEKTSEEGYSILASFDDFGQAETADIRVVNENGTWKISGISFGR